MKFNALREYLFDKYPDSTSYKGDNDGVDVCFDNNAEHSRILLALDFTNETLEYAADNGYDCIITHHPMLFSPLKKLDSETCGISANRAIFAATHKINCLSLHTRLDCAAGGVNDCMLASLGLDSEAAVPFNPEGAAGAGKITILPEEVDLGDFLCGIRDSLGFFYAENFKGSDIRTRINYIKGKSPVKKIAVVGGGGFDYAPTAAACGADTYITGEAQYHKLIDAYDSFGMNIILLGHFETEITVLPALKADLSAKFSIPVDIYLDSKIKQF